MAHVDDLYTTIPEATVRANNEIAINFLKHYSVRSQNWLERTPQLKLQFKSASDPAFQRVVDTSALLHIAEIAECAVPLPRWQDMVTVGGETDYRIFLEVGRVCYDLVRSRLPRSTSKLRILDFGVGCGRTARHFFRDIEEIETHGCDVDAAPIAYIREKMHHVAAVRSRFQPPLPYSTGYMDAVYSISVFTHLDKSSFISWMNELARCIRVGGRAIISFHGTLAWTSILAWDSSRIEGMGISNELIRSSAPSWKGDGFVWVPQHSSSRDIDAAQFGCTFTNEETLANFIPSELRLVEYLKGAISGWQDLAVFERV